MKFRFFNKNHPFLLLIILQIIFLKMLMCLNIGYLIDLFVDNRVLNQSSYQMFPYSIRYKPVGRLKKLNICKFIRLIVVIFLLNYYSDNYYKYFKTIID